MNLFASIRKGVQAIRDTLAYHKAMSQYAKTHTTCECCGAPRMLLRIRLEVHHKTPVHVAPDRATDPENMILLCSSCHFIVGHCGNWRSWNQAVVETAKMVRKAIVDYSQRVLK